MKHLILVAWAISMIGFSKAADLEDNFFYKVSFVPNDGENWIYEISSSKKPTAKSLKRLKALLEKSIYAKEQSDYFGAGYEVEGIVIFEKRVVVLKALAKNPNLVAIAIYAAHETKQKTVEIDDSSLVYSKVVQDKVLFQKLKSMADE